MSDQTDKQPNPPASEEQNSRGDEAVTPTKNMLRSWGIPVILLLAMGVSFYWLRYIYDPLAGRGWVNLMTVIVEGSLTIAISVWFCFLSYFPRKTVLTVIASLVIGGVGWASTIEEIQFDGDLNVTRVIYVWEKDPVPQTAPKVKKQNQLKDEPIVIGEFDLPCFRGVRQDGIIQGPELRTNWEEQPLKELWRTDVGAGYCSMAIVQNSIITLEQRGEKEAVVCYDRKNGQVKWIFEYNARFYEAMGGLGPRTTPTITPEGYVVSMGGAGDVTCVNFYTGNLIWKRNVLEEYSIPNVVWGMSSSPLVYGQTVCVNPGGPEGNGMIGLNLSDGKTLWECSGIHEFTAEKNTNFCGYSSPMIREIDGVSQIVLFDGHGLSGHDLTTGKQLWHHEYLNPGHVNVAQPIVLENQKDIFISSSYENGSAFLTVQRKADHQWNITEHWHDVRILKTKYSNNVYYQGYVYGLDEGILMCIDPKTGKKQWKNGRYGHGQLLLTGNQILVMAESGDLVIVKASPGKFQELSRQMVLPKGGKVWNPHALVNGIVYVRDHLEMAAYDLRK